LIDVTNVSKSFDDLEALKDIALLVNKGSIYGLVGSNGAGKTTLLKIIAGIYKENEGVVEINSFPVFENTDIKARIVFIPDTPFYFNNYSIENLAVYYQRIYPKWNYNRYLLLKDVFNIDPKRRIKTLSRGMQRQVAFWMGFSIMPEVMILDEPMDGLDPVMRQKVKRLIVQDVAERDMTVIISSHNLRELEDICDHIGILHQGRLLIQQDLDDLKADVHKIQIAFAEGIPSALYGDMQVLHYEEKGSVLTMIIRGSYEDIVQSIDNYHPAIIDVLPLTLEEIFIYEMGENDYEIQNIFN
jgi:ABC-2 type transport system ATP-binding protein